MFDVMLSLRDTCHYLGVPFSSSVAMEASIHVLVVCLFRLDAFTAPPYHTYPPTTIYVYSLVIPPHLHPITFTVQSPAGLKCPTHPTVTSPETYDIPQIVRHLPAGHMQNQRSSFR